MKGEAIRIALTAALCVVLPALAGEEERPRLPELTVPGLEVPKVDTGTAVPSLEGVSGTKTEVPKPAAAPFRVTFEVVSVTHARRFVRGKDGCVAEGPFERIALERIPANAPAFQTCVRLSATGAVVAGVRAVIRAPGGAPAARASGEVSFGGDGTPPLTVDYTIDWIGFPARTAGTYHLELEVAGEAKGRHPLPVELAEPTP